MILQMAEGVIVRTVRAGILRRKRWQAEALTIDGEQRFWEAMTPPLTDDAMHLYLIECGLPKADVALFVQAINDPETVPISNAPKATSARRFQQPAYHRGKVSEARGGVMTEV